MNHKIDRDTYIIPPNFIESGTFFGGMFKARNVIEAGILAFAIGVDNQICIMTKMYDASIRLKVFDWFVLMFHKKKNTNQIL